MARGGIRLVHGLTKSTLITYFSGMKKDPKYAFLHAFFLICLSCSFQNSMTKNKPFFAHFAHFCTPKRCTRVECLVLKNNPNYMNFLMSLIPPWHSSAPPTHHKLNVYRDNIIKAYYAATFRGQWLCHKSLSILRKEVAQFTVNKPSKDL